MRSPSIKGAVPRNIHQIQLEAHGLLTETVPRGVCNASLIMVSGTIYYGLVGLYEGDTVSNIHCRMATNGATLTRVEFGLYDRGGALLATTGDVKADFTANTVVKSEALTSVYTVTRTDGYYIAAISVGTTPPVIQCGTSVASLLDTIPPGGSPLFTTQTAQTVLPAAMGTLTTAASASYWLAAS